MSAHSSSIGARGTNPSSGALRYLLPQGEKEERARIHSGANCARRLCRSANCGTGGGLERPAAYAVSSGAVSVKTLPGLAAKMAGIDHFLQQGGRTVFRVVEAFVEDLHHRQHRVEPDEIGQRQRPDRMVAAELHAGVDLFRRRDPLLESEDRL